MGKYLFFLILALIGYIAYIKVLVPTYKWMALRHVKYKEKMSEIDKKINKPK